MWKQYRVSVIIPTKNEEEAIGKVLAEIPRDIVDEIIVVDSSNDRTSEIAEIYGAKVIKESRKGYGRAYKTGFLYATGDIIVTLDGDGSYPAYYVPELIKNLLSEDLDFITTNRFALMEPGSMSSIHKLGNYVLSLACRLLFCISISDSQSGMWCFKRSILRKIMPNNDGMPFSEEIKIRAFLKGKAREVPIVYRRRLGRSKTNTIVDGLRNLLYLVILRLRDV